MPKWVLNPEEEMLRGLRPAQVRAVRALYEGECDLDAGEMARVAEGLRQAAKLIDNKAVDKARVRKGKQKLISGVLFKNVPAHQTDRTKGDVIREKYPKDKFPELYGTTNHKETVEIKVGPIQG